MNNVNFYNQVSFQPYGGGSPFNAAALPPHQQNPSSQGVYQGAMQLMMALQQLQQGFSSFGGTPFVGGFEPGGGPGGGFQAGFQSGGFQAGGFQAGGFQAGGFQGGGFPFGSFQASNPFPAIGGFNPGFPSFPAIGSQTPFIGGFDPGFASFPAIGSQTPFIGGFDPGFASFPAIGSQTPFIGGFQGGGFPPLPSFGGGGSLASQALMFQAGFSDSLIAQNIGVQTGGFASLGAAQGSALAGPFASPFFF